MDMLYRKLTNAKVHVLGEVSRPVTLRMPYVSSVGDRVVVHIPDNEYGVTVDNMVYKDAQKLEFVNVGFTRADSALETACLFTGKSNLTVPSVGINGDVDYTVDMFITKEDDEERVLFSEVSKTKAFYFPGGQRAQLNYDPDVFASYTTDFTLEAWVYPTVDANHVIFGHFLQSADKSRFAIFGRYATLAVKKNGDFYRTDYIEKNNVPLNAWSHIVAVKKGRDVGVYLNGEQVAYWYQSITTNINGTLTFGDTGPNSGDPMRGYVREARICESNVYNASPNASHSDSITVPTSVLSNLPSTQVLLRGEEGLVDLSTSPKAVTSNLGMQVTDAPFLSEVKPIAGMTCALSSTAIKLTQWGTANDYDLSYPISLHPKEWAHLAMVKIGTDMAIALRGQVVGVSDSFPVLENTDSGLVIGGLPDTVEGWEGYVENVHVNSGNVLSVAFTQGSEFTIPTDSDNRVDDVLNIELNEACVDKVSSVTLIERNLVSSLSRWQAFESTEDVSGDDKCLWAGYYSGKAAGMVSAVFMVRMAQKADAQDFANLSGNRSSVSHCTSKTRDVICNGYIGAGNHVNIMDYVGFAAGGQARDFGDQSVSRYYQHSVSDGLRGLVLGGRSGTVRIKTITKIDIAIKGNSSSWGNLQRNRGDGCSFGNKKYGFVAGGYEAGHWQDIERISMASGGNGSSYANLSEAKRALGGASNDIRALIMGGQSLTDLIEYYDMSSGNNTMEFGSLVTPMQEHNGASNKIKVVAGGGYDGSVRVARMTETMFSTRSNAAEFGQLVEEAQAHAGSNSHGGLY